MKTYFYIFLGEGGGLGIRKMSKDDAKYGHIVDGPFDCPVKTGKMLQFWRWQFGANYMRANLQTWGSKTSAWQKQANCKR